MDDELEWLSKIGTHTGFGSHEGNKRDGETPRPEAVAFLLRGYLEGLKLRKRWDGLNRYRLEDAVQTRLRELGIP